MHQSDDKYALKGETGNELWEESTKNSAIQPKNSKYVSGTLFPTSLRFANNFDKYVSSIASGADTSSNTNLALVTTAWVNNKISAITPPTSFDNSMMIWQQTDWRDYFYEPYAVPEGYTYNGCKTDWFPIIDYTASMTTDVLTQFKLDNTHTHQKYTDGTSGWLLHVKFVIVHVPYTTTRTTISTNMCFQPGNTGIDEKEFPFKYCLKSNISKYLWDTKHCAYSDSGLLSSNPCTVQFEDSEVETSMSITMTGRASSTRGFQHDTFEMCFNLPTDQLNIVRIAMGWWYNGNGRTNYSCPPIRYYFTKNAENEEA